MSFKMKSFINQKEIKNLLLIEKPLNQKYFAKADSSINDLNLS
jgi:hypothetical protein